jgi:hypothetical protein
MENLFAFYSHVTTQLCSQLTCRDCHVTYTRMLAASGPDLDRSTGISYRCHFSDGEFLYIFLTIMCCIEL